LLCVVCVSPCVSLAGVAGRKARRRIHTWSTPLQLGGPYKLSRATFCIGSQLSTMSDTGGSANPTPHALPLDSYSSFSNPSPPCSRSLDSFRTMTCWRNTPLLALYRAWGRARLRDELSSAIVRVGSQLVLTQIQREREQGRPVLSRPDPSPVRCSVGYWSLLASALVERFIAEDIFIM
jgi:hypothetical protein